MTELSLDKPQTTNNDLRATIYDDGMEVAEAHEPGNRIRTSILEPPEDLFILQPRTYTPKLPAPIPSPMVRTPVISPAEPGIALDWSSPPLTLDLCSSPSKIPERSSLRQRVSQKTNPPEAIHIPHPQSRTSYQTRQGQPQPPDTADSSGSLSILPASAYRPESSAFRDSTHVRDTTYEDEEADSVPDSAYVSDLDRRRSSSQAHAQRRADPPTFSDTNLFSRADFINPPFAQLQLRPHSADAHGHDNHHHNNNHNHHPQLQQPPPQQQEPVRAQTSHRFLQYPRQLSSRAGTISRLSNATYNPTETSAGASMRGHVGMRSASAAGTAAGGERKLKKKRSAFGWLKKAFTMDDEERAAFEARRLRQTDDFYGDARSLRYLDGRRMQ